MIHSFSVYLKATFTHRELCDVIYLFLDIMCCFIHMLILLHVSTTSKDVGKFLQTFKNAKEYFSLSISSIKNILATLAYLTS